MKIFKSVFLFFLLCFLMAGQAQAQTPKKGWSNKAKGAVIGGGAGAVTGAVIGGGKGAIIGGAAGVIGGGLIGRKRDKKRDPARYNNYRNVRK